MQGDIALAGFMMTAEEWQALDAASRALLLALAEVRPERADVPDRVQLAAGTGPTSAQLAD